MAAYLTTWALTTDKSQPIYLQADAVKYNYKQGIVDYLGHVSGKQGSTTLQATTMQVYYNAAHQIKKVIAQGNPAHYSTQVQRDKNQLHAFANTLIYYPLAGKAILINQAKIQYNQSEFTGPYITYDIFNEVITSHPQKNSTTKIVLEPIKNFK